MYTHHYILGMMEKRQEIQLSFNKMFVFFFFRSCLLFGKSIEKHFMCGYYDKVSLTETQGLYSEAILKYRLNRFEIPSLNPERVQMCI